MKGKLSLIATAAMALATPCVGYYEGVVFHTYADPVGIPTICSGHTGPDVTPGRVATQDECDSLTQQDLRRTDKAMQQCIHVEMEPYEYAAVLSWAYNVGTSAACSSTLVRMLNAGAPGYQWCSQLDRWKYATKLWVTIELPGLVKRRAAEKRMCLTGSWQ